jgi:hypothetical protein
MLFLNREVVGGGLLANNHANKCEVGSEGWARRSGLVGSEQFASHILLSSKTETETTPDFVSRMRGTRPICGQTWIQEDRRMTVTNTVLPDTEDSREAVWLAGIVEALVWRHVLESNPEFQIPGREW